jgi:hypothetical protein
LRIPIHPPVEEKEKRRKGEEEMRGEVTTSSPLCPFSPFPPMEGGWSPLLVLSFSTDGGSVGGTQNLKLRT